MSAGPGRGRRTAPPADPARILNAPGPARSTSGRTGRVHARGVQEFSDIVDPSTPEIPKWRDTELG
ncbi:hypothetical protein [Streptomyces sp. NPDC001020]